MHSLCIALFYPLCAIQTFAQGQEHIRCAKAGRQMIKINQQTKEKVHFIKNKFKRSNTVGQQTASGRQRTTAKVLLLSALHTNDSASFSIDITSIFYALLHTEMSYSMRQLHLLPGWPSATFACSMRAPMFFSISSTRAFMSSTNAKKLAVHTPTCQSALFERICLLMSSNRTCCLAQSTHISRQSKSVPAYHRGEKIFNLSATA